MKHLDNELQKKAQSRRAHFKQGGEDVAANQDEKIDHYIQELRETEAFLVERQSAFTGEIEGLKRLVDLYKRYFEDATAKVERM